MNEYETIKKLVSDLNAAAVAYYSNGDVKMSNSEYDRTYDLLKHLEQKTGILLHDSPTRRVGADTHNKDKHQHRARMYSLDKVKARPELEKFMTTVAKAAGNSPPFVVEYKFDGVSVELQYRHGYLVDAVTRGDGEYGESVFLHVEHMSNVPKQLNEDANIDIRGEIIASRKKFAEYNKTAEKKLKNERNAVAGVLASLRGDMAELLGMNFIPYDIGNSDVEFASINEMLTFFQRNGFDTGICHLPAADIDSAMEAINTIKESRESLDFLIDGAVIKACDFELREKMGHTSKHPLWAMAYKFEPCGGWTTLTKVEWQVGKSGVLTPVAVFDQIEVGGCNVKKASLYNYTSIQASNIHLFDEVYIERSNDVIPKLAAAVRTSDSVPIDKPTVCPICGAPVIEDGASLVCTGRDCRPQIIARMSRFVSRGGLNLTSIGEKNVEFMVDELGFKHPYQIIRMTSEEIDKLPINTRRKKRLVEEIQLTRIIPLRNILFALGVPGVGKSMAENIEEKYSRFSKLLKAHQLQLTQVQNMGWKVATEIIEYLNCDESAQNLKDWFL